jgi:hypothetical protein
MKFAYADPPYIGQAKRHYDCPEVNHANLIKTLTTEFDGWALSLSSPSLQEILALCPTGIRVLAWVKPFAIFKPGVNPAYAWEPVILYNGRRRTRQQPTVRDWVSANITLKRGLTGAKPEAFCNWLFEVAGLEPSDQFHDLFVGTGGVTRAWNNWCESKKAGEQNAA